MDDKLRGVENLLEVQDRGRPVIQIGLLTTLFFRDAHKAEVKEKIVTCIENYLEMCRSNLSWLRHTRKLRFRSIDAQSVLSPREWLFQNREGTGWEFEARGGQSSSDANPFSISGLGVDDNGLDEFSYFRATLPITFFTEHGGHFVDLVRSFCNQIQPSQGYGGLGILESPDEGVADRYEPAVRRIADRFPGLEVDYPTSHSLYVENGIKSVNWLTALGNEWLSKLGGIQVLKRDLGSHFELRDYSGGVLIQAGPRPQMGDLEKSLIPEEYVLLAHVLRSIRITRHRPFQHSGSGRFDRQASEAWLSRFDRMYPMITKAI